MSGRSFPHDSVGSNQIYHTLGRSTRELKKIFYILAVHGAQQEDEVIYEVLEKCAPKTGFPHCTELD